MKVFISWSGDASRQVAAILRDKLPCMIQELDVFMSEHDVESGTRWILQLAKKLEECNFGILCLTRNNLHAPWLLFEAGSLAKHVEGRACGLLLGGVRGTDVTGPFAQFQHRSFEESDFRMLMRDINLLLEAPLQESKLDKVFRQWWPTLNTECQAALTSARSSTSKGPKREDHEILDEMLRRIRNIERTVAGTEPPTSYKSPRRIDHFYTISTEEASFAMTARGYDPLPGEFYVHSSPVANTVPLFRLLNVQTGDHFYTIRESERDTAMHRHGYSFEKIACYVHSSQEEGTVPLFRLWNPMVMDHLYTASESERDRVVASMGYRYEGIEGYVYDSPIEGTVPMLGFMRSALDLPQFARHRRPPA